MYSTTDMVQMCGIFRRNKLVWVEPVCVPKSMHWSATSIFIL